MRKIKILYLIDNLFKGGTENQIIELINNISEEKFSVSLIILNDFDKPLLDQIKCPVKIVNKKFSRFNFIRILLFLYCYLKRNKVDIVQTQFIESELYAYFVLSIIKKKIKFIVSRRNLYHWVNEHKIVFFLHRLSINKSDMIIANSHEAKKKCVYLEKVKARKIIVMPNALEVKNFSGILSNRSRKILGLAKSDIIVGVVGNWRPVKGIVTFLQSAQMLNKKYSNIKFILAGRGEQKRELVDLVSNFGLEDRVLFYENYKNIPLLMSTFDIAVQPSLSESVSNVWLEYMILKLPIVATKVGDAEHIFEHMKDAVLVPANNPQHLYEAISYLINHKKESKIFGKNAYYKVAKKWDLPVVIKKYENFYQNFINL